VTGEESGVRGWRLGFGVRFWGLGFGFRLHGSGVLDLGFGVWGQRFGLRG
jgi:hypothetical protein